jgi:hypothetical protein
MIGAGATLSLQSMEPDPKTASARLVECEQRLASLPDLEHSLERALEENARLRRELEAGWKQMEELTRSPSWRLTAPLRRLRQVVRRGGA